MKILGILQNQWFRNPDINGEEKLKRIEGEFYLDDSRPEKTTKVWITLTDYEYDEMIRAYNQLRLLLMFWKCPADFMSAEIESILCGYRPDRYSPRE